MANLCPCCIMQPNVSLAEQQWHSLYDDELKKRVLPNPKSQRWGLLLLTWHEKKDGGKILKHRYAACVDRHEGNFYLDCTPFKIYLKCLAQLIGRPIHTSVKTLYHLSFVGPLFYEISQTWKGYQSKEVCLKNILKSTADIIRTPIYSVVLTVTSIAVLVFSPFNNNLLYSGRACLGKIEQKANWDEKHTPWTLNNCFQPFDLSLIESSENTDRSYDTVYTSDNPLDRQLTHFARRLIRYNRHNFDPFSCQKLAKNQTYISPILPYEPMSTEPLAAN